MNSPRPDTRLLAAFSSAFVTAAFRDATSLTSTLNADDGSDAVLMPATPAIGSRLALGSTAQFDGVELEITTNGVASWTVTWEYRNPGGTWSVLSGVTDATAGFTAGTGVFKVSFDRPSDWTAFGGTYYIQARLSAFTSMTTNPRGDYAKTFVNIDTSQYATQLSSSGTAYYEDPSARTALDGTGTGRSLELSIELDNTMSGTLLAHGGDIDSTPVYEITVASGTVTVTLNGTAIAAIAAPNVDGTAKTYIVAANTEPNPATTGASDALRTESLVYDVDGAALTYTVATHAVHTADVAGAFSVGGEWNGATMLTPFDGIINACRVSARFHTRTEVREHWVADTATPSVSGIVAVEAPVFPSDACVAGAIAGPQYQAAAAAMAIGRNRHRLVSPILQVFTPSPPVFTDDLTDTITPPRVLTLSDGYQTHLGWMWRRRIPRHTDWLRAVIAWATWDTLGGAIAANVRLYCSANPPNLADSAEWGAVTLARTTSDGVSGNGVRTDFDQLRVRRDPDGWSWIWLGLDLTNANNRAIARALLVTPVSRAANANEPPNQWSP